MSGIGKKSGYFRGLNVFVLAWLAFGLIVTQGCDTRPGKKGAARVRSGAAGRLSRSDTRDLSLAESILSYKIGEVSFERDPFQRAGVFIADEEVAAPVTEPLDLELKGILFSDIDPRAWITGKDEMFIVKENDLIGRIKIKKIDKDRVLLEVNGNIVTLKVREE